MDLGLDGKSVVVTGASKGIGLAVAQAFAAEGARVVGGARTVTPELAGVPGATAVEVDLATAEGPARLVREAVQEHGGVDVLVNNVGGMLAPRPGGFLSVPDPDWLPMMEWNLMTMVRASRAAIPHLLQRRGAIVTVSSINARLTEPAVVDYAATKAAVSSVNKALSMEFGAQGLRVNTVSPGPVRTPFWLAEDGLANRLAHAQGTDARTAMRGALAGTGGSATGRFSEPHEVAALVVFLASERAGNTTGADHVVDGGIVKTT
ncbi:oxidoreductase [Patulibacter americanus]|uniref:oxidoreductase n=1 Tax=Patulibacter americanus TaxID=588672 RepID=UPI0003B49E2C|nr:oxidoreductase [Patulibacter americanus]